MQPDRCTDTPDAAQAAPCAEIERCNQRGGRMLSIVDLLEAGTFTRDQAAIALAAIRGGASFMVGALPGGAGKTTVMGALLNLLPPTVRLVPAESPASIADGLRQREERRCYICHEIGAGPYYAYLWGEPLRRYFELPDAGHLLATNLHADTYAQAREQVCGQNGVPPAHFRRLRLILFLSVARIGARVHRRVSSLWVSDGQSDHGKVELHDALPGIAARDLREAHATLDRLMTSGRRRIEDIYAELNMTGAGP